MQPFFVALLATALAADGSGSDPLDPGRAPQGQSPSRSLARFLLKKVP